MTLQLLQLPNEVLARVISLTANADLDNFASTSKVIRSLASNALSQHRKRKRAFAKITYCDGRPNRKSTMWEHPTLILRDLIAKDLLCYPVQLYIDNRGYNYRCPEDLIDSSESDGASDSSDASEASYPDVDRALKLFPKDIGPLVRVCPYLNSDESLIAGVLEKGGIGVTLGFLLTLLPNLSVVHCMDCSEDMWAYCGSLKTVIQNMLHIGYDHTSTSGISAPPLPKLREVTFTRHPEHFVLEKFGLSKWKPLFHLPSVRSIRVNSLEPNDWEYPEFHSNIEEFAFYDTKIEADKFKTYLKNPHNLQKFTIEFSFKVSLNRGSGFVPREFTQILLSYACHSLRHLELIGVVYDIRSARGGDRYIGSLKDMRVLESVKVGGTMFIQPLKEKGKLQDVEQMRHRDEQELENGTPRKLIEMLPSSIVSVEFINERTVCGSGVDHDVAISMLQGLPERKAELLPNLQFIDFRTNLYKFEPEDGALLCACRDAGVKIRHGIWVFH